MTKKKNEHRNKVKTQKHHTSNFLTPSSITYSSVIFQTHFLGWDLVYKSHPGVADAQTTMLVARFYSGHITVLTFKFLYIDMYF